MPAMAQEKPNETVTFHQTEPEEIEAVRIHRRIFLPTTRTAVRKLDMYGFWPIRDNRMRNRLLLWAAFFTGRASGANAVFNTGNAVESPPNEVLKGYAKTRIPLVVYTDSHSI